MRKLIITALVLLALGFVAGANSAYAAGCGCKDKCGCEKKSCCEQKSCTKCSKCESPCKSKCGCKEKCAPKCSKGCGKCNTCRPMRCDCRPHTSCKDYDACCPPQAGVQEICLDDCAVQSVKHPYELCFNGSGMLCDTGCCGVVLPCKRKCQVCHTTCKKVECADGCGCPTVHYEYETTCEEIVRPRVVPWWFNDKGSGNIYLDENGQQMGVSPITDNEYATAEAHASEASSGSTEG
jgi:hypothetical protein